MRSDSGTGLFGQRAEALALGFFALAGVFHVVASSGGSTTPRLVALVATGLCAGAAALAGGARFIDGWRLPLLILFLTQAGEVLPRLNGPDGFEYYVLARSPLFDHDLELGNDYEGLETYGQRSAGGRPVSRTPLGLAILWTPVIVLTHALTLVARAFGSTLPADGFSMPYQAAVTYASFLFAVCAVFLTEAVVRRRHSPPIGLLVAFGLWAATPLAYYAVRLPSRSHAASALVMGAFLALFLERRDSTRPKDWWALGVLGGLMSIVRIQDGALLVVPLADQLASRRPGWARRVGALLAGPVVAAVLQAVVWRTMWGPDFVAEVSERNWFRGNLHLVEVLVSPLHGLFTWTPLWLLSAVGWLILGRREIRLGLLALLGFAAVTLVNAGIDDWWGGPAFGQRRFLGLTLLFGLGLGAFLEYLERRPLLGAGVVFLGLALWNQQLTVIFRGRHLGGREDPVTLDRLAGAQVESFYHGWLAGESRLPRWLFVVGYDNLKGIWLDEGRSLNGRVDLTLPDAEQPLPFLVGEGWLTPTQKEGVAFRRSRGPRSAIRVPVYSPGDFRMRLRARSVLGGVDVPIALEVNGHGAGQQVARPEWGDLAYDIPASSLSSGLNTLAFEYGLTRRDLEPGNRGLNSAVAVQDVRFERLPPGGSEGR